MEGLMPNHQTAANAVQEQLFLYKLKIHSIKKNKQSSELQGPINNYS